MKAIMYTTNDYGTYLSKPIYESLPLAGITTATKVETAAGEGFLGCGAAITGSSRLFLI